MKRCALMGLLLLSLVLASCANKPKQPEVNIYAQRNYDVDQVLYDQFTKTTGIKVNVIKAGGDELVQRLLMEGANTQADLIFTIDAAILNQAYRHNLLKPITTQASINNVKESLREPNNYWLPVTYRARVLVYNPTQTDISSLKNYSDLANPEWQGKILTRSATNSYNQSLIASYILNNGSEATEEWIKGVVSNLAREPKGNDRDQAKAIAAGIGEVAIMNSYYMGRMFYSVEAEEVAVAQQLALFFPNQESQGTHINVSGVGITAAAKNSENAEKLVQFLTEVYAQTLLSTENFEYPANPSVELHPLVASWGSFKADEQALFGLDQHLKEGQIMADRLGWK